MQLISIKIFVDFFIYSINKNYFTSLKTKLRMNEPLGHYKMCKTCDQFTNELGLPIIGLVDIQGK